MVFNNVSFAYQPEIDVLHNVDLYLRRGETYALVGPTGGGKTTTASLMARLYDPNSGQILLDGKDIRSYTEQERSQKVSVILQEPFLFSGTIKENILYGNDQYLNLSDKELIKVLDEHHFTKLLKRFDQGLKTTVKNNGESISLGQKQLIAFMRVVLRDPDLLILDEATANVDTVTEQLLDEILQTLPATTTKVIIAHRLNTIDDADLIFFVNNGVVTPTGSLDKAVSMLMKQKRSS
jgi:ATP-binding cassette subfamily B protein